MTYINLTPEQINSDHICCAFSDKKCAEGYQLKRNWLTEQHDSGYRFLRLDERAKVFIEYGPVETAWLPITAPNHLALGCFWVSGKYAKNGHGKKLLTKVIETAKDQGKSGIVAVTAKKKFHFMSDGRWLKRQGFTVADTLDTGFELLVLALEKKPSELKFNPSTQVGSIKMNKGITAYYSNRCPYTEFHLHTSLTESCKKRDIPLSIIKLKTLNDAQNAPSPATIFSMFYNGQFVTTDLSSCMDGRFDKAIKGF